MWCWHIKQSSSSYPIIIFKTFTQYSACQAFYGPTGSLLILIITKAAAKVSIFDFFFHQMAQEAIWVCNPECSDWQATLSCLMVWLVKTTMLCWIKAGWEETRHTCASCLPNIYCYYYLFLMHLCYPWVFGNPIMQLVFLFCKNFGLLSLFSCVYCLKIHRDLKALPASLLRGWLHG